MIRNCVRIAMVVFCSWFSGRESLHAQLPDSEVTKFSLYLIKNKKLTEALHVLKPYCNKTGSVQNKDSICYLAGYCFLKQEQWDSARKYFSPLLVSADTGLREKATVFFNHIRLHDLDSIKQAEPAAGQRAKEINRIHSLSYLLLMHNYAAFRKKFDKEEKCRITELAAVEFDLLLCYYDLVKIRKKNKVLAGFLSAILPGSGKLYTGKKHEALLSFLPVALNGAQAAEGYYHQQFSSPHFYVFGAIGLVFYSSNIYGSARSATIINEEKYEKVRLKIFSGLDSVVPQL